MKILRYISLCLGILAFSAVAGNTAHAATRLTPQHLYRWVDTNNIMRLHQFKRYINLQDQDKNTALCLAQQAKNKKAYALLLKYGASTKVPCHNDNDPICAIIAGEKTKVSPAGLLLLGAGAAAGAYLLLDDDDECKVSNYPLDDCPDHGQCSSCKNKKRLDLCDEFWEPNEEHTECLPIPCPAGEYTVCENKDGYSTTATPTESKSGDAQCHTCSYACDTTTGNYESKTACETANDEYICTQNTNGCYSATSPADCPIDHPSEAACVRNDSEYTTNEDIRVYGGRPCYNCSYECNVGETTCPNGKVCTEITTPDGKTCQINAVCPTDYTETTEAACETANPGYYCTESAAGSGCWKKDPTNPKQCTIPAVKKNTCEAAKTGFILTETETGELSGDTPCVDCNYTCDAASGYYTNVADCTSGGYACASVEQQGLQCYFRSGPLDCPVDHPSETACSISEDYDTTETSITYGGRSCYNCTYKCKAGEATCPSGKVCTDVTTPDGTVCHRNPQCPTGYTETTKTACETANPGYTCTESAAGSGCWKKDDTNPKQCTLPAVKKNTCETAKTGFVLTETETGEQSGDTPCVNCVYSCAAGYYDTQTLCQTTSGQTCTSVSQGTKTCWAPNGSCPTDAPYTSKNQCETANPGYNCTESATGSGCWKKDPTNPKQCTLPAVKKGTCETAKTGFVLTETETGEQSGDTPCVNCVYSCAAGYYDTQTLCQTTSGQTCTSVSQGTKTCWTPTGACPSDAPYTSKNQCETANPGYNCTENTTGSGCWKKDPASPKQCTAPAVKKGTCEAAKTGFLMNEQDTGEQSGDTPCVNCVYACDAASGYYKNYSDCISGGFTCDNVEQNGMTCYFRNGSSSCPIDHPSETACPTSEDYDTTQDTITYGGRTCYSCSYSCKAGETTCPTGKVCTDVTTPDGTVCHRNPQCPTGYTETTKTACEAANPGYNCTENVTGSGCWKKDTAKQCTLPAVKKNTCEIAKTGFVLTETETGEQSGDTPCVNCVYSCATGYYDSQTLCESTTGKTCNSIEQKGKICWYSNGSCPADYPYNSKAQCEQNSNGYACVESATGSGCWKPGTAPLSCTSGYDTKYQSVDDCGDQAENGWTYSSSGMSGGLKCGMCTMKNCPINTSTAYASSANCTSYSNLKTTVAGTSNYHGDDRCYQCNYACNETTAFASLVTCQNGGWNCTTSEQNSITCYIRGSAANCPATHPSETACPTSSNYNTTQDTTTYGGRTCYSCSYSCKTGETSCPAGKVCTDVTTPDGTVCHRNPQCPTGYTETTKTACETANPGYNCTESATGSGCWKKDPTNPKECTPPSVKKGSYEAAKTGFVLTENETGEFSGDTPCVDYAYSCATGYYDTQTLCQNATGKTCSSISQGTKTCWYSTNTCPADYPYASKALCEQNSNGYGCVESATGSGCWKPGTTPLSCPPNYTAGLNDCSAKTYEDGWTYSSNGMSGGLKCGMCTAKTCPAGADECNWEPDDGKFFMCNSVANGSHAGDSICYDYYAACSSSAFTSEAACVDSGKYVCSSSSKGSAKCWIRNGVFTCPEGYDVKYQSVDDCGEQAENGWTYSSIGESGGYKCGMCTAKTCPANASADYASVSKCTQDSHLKVTVTGTSSYHGDDLCYQCNYACNETTAFASLAKCESEYGLCKTADFFTTSGTINCYVWSQDTLSINSNKTMNTTLLRRESMGTENVYGLSDNVETLKNTTDRITGETGRIEILHNSTGNAYGMFAGKDNTLVNDTNAVISIKNNSTGAAYGMYASEGGTAINRGNISIDGLDGTAYGIYGEGQNTIENLGNIDVSGRSAYGIYVKDGQGSNILNAGTITVNATDEAHGIFVDKNSASAVVNNTGTIVINGETKAGQTGITLNGAKLKNYSMMRFNGNTNLNALGGSVYLENGGVYAAQSLAGDLNVGTSTVLGGNLDTYINTAALETEDIKDLNLTSESAMFTAETQRSEEGKAYDVVMNRKSFNEFTPNASLSSYLEANYQDGKLESVYDSLKSETDAEGVKKLTAKKLGYDIMPNFADENFTALKSLNRNIADTILKPTDETNRVIAGYDNINWETDTKGMLSGADLSVNSMYTFGDKRLNNHNRLGLGLSFTKLSSDYDVGGDRDLNIVSIFMPYMHKFAENLRLASVLSVGYGYGEYDRGSNNESDLKDIFYGLTNELRYTINLNGFAELEPALMLNAIGYYEDGYDEGNGTDAIETKKTHHASVEAGIGLFLKKEVTTSEHGKFGFKVGGAYYRELASPYDDISGRMKNGNNMWYRINDYANLYSKDRAIIEAMVDYEYKKLGVYAKYNRLIQKNDPQLFDLGIKYKF